MKSKPSAPPTASCRFKKVVGGKHCRKKLFGGRRGKHRGATARGTCFAIPPHGRGCTYSAGGPALDRSPPLRDAILLVRVFGGGLPPRKHARCIPACLQGLPSRTQSTLSRAPWHRAWLPGLDRLLPWLHRLLPGLHPMHGSNLGMTLQAKMVAAKCLGQIAWAKWLAAKSLGPNGYESAGGQRDSILAEIEPVAVVGDSSVPSRPSKAPPPPPWSPAPPIRRSAPL